MTQNNKNKIEISIDELRKKKIFLGIPMFGGQCYGTLTRSLMDLQALCTHYGIELCSYFIFNESLIPRARNYCIHKDMIVPTEDGNKTIKEIVDSKYSGKVLSLDKNDKLVWKNVKNHWSRVNDENKKWVKIYSGTRTKKSLVCTDEHEVAIISDILLPKIEYIKAKDINDKYLVRKINDIDSNRSREMSLYNNDQMSVIMGSLMGDGHINKHGVFGVKHSCKQKEYVKFKQDILGGKLKIDETITKINILGNECYRNGEAGLSIFATEQTKYLREIFYENGIRTCKKILPYLNEKSLAFWYMDDGSLHKPENKKPFSTIYSLGFSYDDNILIQQWLKDKYGFNVSVNTMKYDSGEKYYIQFSAQDTIKLSNLLRKYIPKSMEYKLVNNNNDDEKYEFNNKRLEYSALKVVEVEYLNDYRCSSNLYDIEVEDTHNFFANGTLVHNCADEFLNRSDCTHLMFIDADIGFNPMDVITLAVLDKDIICGPYPKKVIGWEKVNQIYNSENTDLLNKINENPNILENYIGDYVFNPLHNGKSSVLINEPFQVLESGTGFMMIKRESLERFRDYFPQYSYKPDHNRTEHFDGSREIHMFFHCEIDPESKRYLSEDYWYCQKSRESGSEIWLCPWMELTHTGTYTFKGSLSKLAEANLSHGGLVKKKSKPPEDGLIREDQQPPKKKSGLEVK